MLGLHDDEKRRAIEPNPTTLTPANVKQIVETTTQKDCGITITHNVREATIVKRNNASEQSNANGSIFRSFGPFFLDELCHPPIGSNELGRNFNRAMSDETFAREQC